MRKLLQTFLLWALAFQISSAESNIELYTKADCGNCTYAKEYLNRRGISFQEHPTANPSQGDSMVIRLRATGYQGPIFMPVIFRDREIVHPVWKSDTGLVRISLRSALEFLSEDIFLQNGEPTEDESDECTDTTIYRIVCGDFSTIERAQHFQKVLYYEGYTKSGIYKESNAYHVYASEHYDLGHAKEEMSRIRENYRGAHIVKINE